MKYKDACGPLCEEGPNYLHQDLKDPRLVHEMNPPHPQGEAACEEGRGKADLINTKVSELLLTHASAMNSSLT